MSTVRPVDLGWLGLLVVRLMRVLVCGGRDYANKPWLFTAMMTLNMKRGPFTEVIHGGAGGADSMAGEWAREHSVRIRVFLADWTRYGKRAGPIRNQQMLDERPDLVVAFPGGRGTADMVRRARAAGVEVIEVE